jgi:energy-coupling factor transporter ATP-binding protein EcfA2
MKLKIENFQSLEGITELEFKPGISLIVGPSNSGKTALQRALKGLILNYRGDVKKYLTHFKDHLQVDLQLTEDGTVYSWTKTAKGQTEYQIIDQDGDVQNYEKCGNEDIYSFEPNFPFVLRDKQLINLYTEKEGLPFPFNLNDVELFKMFEELYNISSSAVIFKFMKKLETQTNSNISTNKETIAQNKTRLEKIVEVEDRYDLEKLETLKERAEKVQAGMLGIDDDIKTAAKNNKISKAIKAVLEEAKDPAWSAKLVDIVKTNLEDANDLQKDIRIVNSNSKIENVNIYKKELDTAVIEPFKALSSDYKLANTLENSLKDLEEQANELESEYKEVKEQLSQIKTCPLCGQSLEGVHLHE